MTFIITRENVYFIICVVLLALQVYQQKKIARLKKDFQLLANQVMILFFSLKIKQDEEKGVETKQNL